MADNLPHSRADVTESGCLNFQEPFEPHRPVMGLLYIFTYIYIYILYIYSIYTHAHTDTHAYTRARACMLVRIHYGDQINWACEVNSRI
jgi:hypothetical protein